MPAPTLLTSADPQPCSVYNENGKAPVLIICDHASAYTPPSLDGLGLAPARLDEHIAYDIGALDASKALADACDAPLVYCNYSRLVIDCNRYPGDPGSIPAMSDGVRVPGNVKLNGAARAARVAEIFQPYHAAVTAQIDRFTDRGVSPALILVHSCTPQLNEGPFRPWEIGILWALDERMSRPVMDNLKAADACLLGDNEPYSLDPAIDYSGCEHAMRRGLPHLQLEFRQDLINTADGARRWAEILYGSIAPVLADETLYRPAHYWP